MPNRARLLILTAVIALIFAARSLTPPPPSVSGAFGSGPTIVLVHGLGSRDEHWLPAARILAQDHRVVLVDLPGHGASPMPDPFSFDRAVAALDLALARETARGPCILVGHSVGGLIAAGEALEHPERVRGLVLVETALKPQVTGAERETLLDALDRDYQGVLKSVYGTFGRDSAQGEALYREVAAMDPVIIKTWVRLALTADLSQAAARLEMPVLAVLAARSWPQGEAWSATAEVLGYSLIPRARGERVTDCGHFVMLDQPAIVARAIERFAADPAGSLVALR
jgi:pimeloyl-ACP methyl ester carboxylesterase